MKIHPFLTTVCAAALVSGGAFAQNAASQGSSSQSALSPSASSQNAGAQSPSAQSSANLIDAAKLEGQQVKNPQGEELGEIKQVLIDPQSGRVRYAVVQVNKAWQFNDPEVAVPWGAFQINGKPGEPTFKLTLNATKQKLENAPKFKAGDADRLYSQQSAQPVYSYWAIIWVDDAANPGAQQSTAGSQQSGSSSSSTASHQPGGSSSGAPAASANGSGSSGSGNSATGSGANASTPPSR